MEKKNNFSAWKNWLIVLCFFCVFIAPRLSDLGTYATADEPLYIKSSASFFYLLNEGRFSETGLIIHPGVVNLWAGAASYFTFFPDYAEHGATKYPIGDNSFRIISGKMDHPRLEMLAFSRAVTVVIQAVLLGAALFFAMRAYGRWPALIGFLLISFEPYYFANSRILQPDGILAASLILSVTAYIDYLQTEKKICLIASGVGAGLCWLSKLVGIVLGPIVFGIVVYSWWRFHRGDSKKALQMVRDLVVWLVVGLAIFTAFWPVMWVAPLETLAAYFKQTFLMSQQVNSPMFFNGSLNPEGEFGLKYFYYYPLVLFNLTTPLVLLGLGSLGFLWRRRKEIGGSRDLTFSSVGFSIALVLFLVLMTLSIKKADRYVVSAFILLDLLAGIGYWLLFNWLRVVFPNLKTWIAVGGITLVVGLQAWLVFNVKPYYHSYYNPMWGSAARYTEQFQVGWGEGLDQAADYLNKQEGVNNKIIYSWYSATFDLFYNYRTEELAIPPSLLDNQFEDVLAADYAVIYISQWQRQPETKLIQYLSDKEPEYTVVINGFEYVKVYNMRDLAAQAGE